MHWSRAMLSSLLVVVAAMLGITSFWIHMLEVIASQQQGPRATRPPDRIRPARRRAERSAPASELRRAPQSCDRRRRRRRRRRRAARDADRAARGGRVPRRTSPPARRAQPRSGRAAGATPPASRSRSSSRAIQRWARARCAPRSPARSRIAIERRDDVEPGGRGAAAPADAAEQHGRIAQQVSAQRGHPVADLLGPGAHAADLRARRCRAPRPSTASSSSSRLAKWR